MGARMPALFLTHGGGPMPLLQPNHVWNKGLVKAIKSVSSRLQSEPKAILLISGHFEEDVPTVVTAEKPGMLYDYGNFPPEAYRLQYPVAGDPSLAQKTQKLLREAGIENKSISKRGLDHGAFVPLMLAFPEAKIPVVQLSLASSLDPKLHIKIGEALAPLREEGVLIIGSGSSFHNVSAIMRQNGSDLLTRSQEFDTWLQNTLSKKDLSPSEREEEFAKWSKAPESKFCHPREEHLIPAHVCLGSALGEKAEIIFSGLAMGAACSSFAWL